MMGHRIFYAMMIEDLIKQGRAIEQGMSYVNSPEGIIRLYDAYRPADVDEYYGWKERSIRFLQLYSTLRLQISILLLINKKNGRCTLQTYCKEVIYEELYGAWYTFFEHGWIA